MGKSKYAVHLTDDQRSFLEGLIRRGKSASSTIRHAYILLHADKPDNEVAEIVRCHPQSVFNVRKTFVTQGLDAALHRKLRDEPPRPRKLDGAGEARLIQIACSEPPEGRIRWTLQLLADKLVELQVVESISTKTVERTLKKNELQPHIRKQWIIPPDENGNFVAAMEDVLEVYQRPYDPARPVICMDEKSICMRKYESLSPHNQAGRRSAITSTKEMELPTDSCSPNLWGCGGGSPSQKLEQKKDWAHQIQQLLDKDYRDAEKVILVCDNLNTHVPGAFYETFPPEKAWALLSRLEIHHTPKHGSWLNIAEIELSALTAQCLDRRIPTIEVLRTETSAWNRKRNQSQKGVDWQFTTGDARIKLKWLYPMILEN